MMTETALVVQTQGRRARVRVQRNEACASCAAAGACQAMGGGKEVEVEVINFLPAKEGDRVELCLPETSFLKASTITYMVPLAGLILGALLGQLLALTTGGPADALTIAGAALGLAAAAAVVLRYNRRFVSDERYIPRVIRILPPAPLPGPAGGNTADTG
ncbi:MAG: SoxR reducing system RseC family protein [Thermodesulfobacteriota bacterium]